MKYHTRPSMLIISFVFYTQYEVKRNVGSGKSVTVFGAGYSTCSRKSYYPAECHYGIDMKCVIVYFLTILAFSSVTSSVSS